MLGPLGKGRFDWTIVVQYHGSSSRGLNHYCRVSKRSVQVIEEKAYLKGMSDSAWIGSVGSPF